MDGFTADFKDWLSHPFSEDMDAKHWLMLVGLLFVCVWFWTALLAHLIDALKG